MNQDQANELFGMLQDLDNKVAIIKAEINNRFNSHEQRLTNLQHRMKTMEDSIAALAEHGTVRYPRVPAPPAVANTGYSNNPLPRRGAYTPQQGQRGVPPQTAALGFRVTGSGENAGFLPFAMEHIEKKRQRKRPDDDRKCTYCGAETFSLNCFRLSHFRWCRAHQRPILPPHASCGRDYNNCQQVKWEVHHEWETLVEMSFAAGLGKSNVANLREKLFPREDFPYKYTDDGRFMG